MDHNIELHVITPYHFSFLSSSHLLFSTMHSVLDMLDSIALYFTIASFKPLYVVFKSANINISIAVRSPHELAGQPWVALWSG